MGGGFSTNKNKVQSTQIGEQIIAEKKGKVIQKEEKERRSLIDKEEEKFDLIASLEQDELDDMLKRNIDMNKKQAIRDSYDYRRKEESSRYLREFDRHIKECRRLNEKIKKARKSNNPLPLKPENKGEKFSSYEIGEEASSSTNPKNYGVSELPQSIVIEMDKGKGKRIIRSATSEDYSATPPRSQINNSLQPILPSLKSLSNKSSRKSPDRETRILIKSKDETRKDDDYTTINLALREANIVIDNTNFVPLKSMLSEKITKLEKFLGNIQELKPEIQLKCIRNLKEMNDVISTLEQERESLKNFIYKDNHDEKEKDLTTFVSLAEKVRQKLSRYGKAIKEGVIYDFNNMIEAMKYLINLLKASSLVKQNTEGIAHLERDIKINNHNTYRRQEMLRQLESNHDSIKESYENALLAATEYLSINLEHQSFLGRYNKCIECLQKTIEGLDKSFMDKFYIDPSENPSDSPIRCGLLPVISSINTDDRASNYTPPNDQIEPDPSEQSPVPPQGIGLFADLVMSQRARPQSPDSQVFNAL